MNSYLRQICAWVLLNASMVVAEPPNSEDLAYLATKHEATVQRVMTLKGIYSLRDETPRRDDHGNYVGKNRIRTIRIDFATDARSDHRLRSVFEVLEPDPVDSKQSKLLGVPNHIPHFISILRDDSYFFSDAWRSSREGVRIDSVHRQVNVYPREHGSGRLDVLDPMNFYSRGSADIPSWLRSIATSDLDTKNKFELTKNGPVWTLTLKVEAVSGFVSALHYDFDRRVDFLQTRLLETCNGELRYLFDVSHTKKNGIFVPNIVDEESYDFEQNLQFIRHYSLESVEVNTKFSESEFGFEQFDLRNGDTKVIVKTGERTRYWEGEFVSEAEYREKSREAMQRASAVNVPQRPYLLAWTVLVGCLCIPILWHHRRKKFA